MGARKKAAPPPAPINRNVSGSLLPSSDSEVLRLIEHAKGALQVRVMKEDDTHGLYYRPAGCEGFMVIAMHGNGYSCRHLAKAIVDVWDGKKGMEAVFRQVDYILDCGGLARKRDTFQYIAEVPVPDAPAATGAK